MNGSSGVMHEILAATGNDHKLRELREILRPRGLCVLGARDVDGLPDVIEDGDTFVANAVKKAVTVAREKGYRVLADDSGLEVLALKGEPGVRSARYAGKHGDDAGNTRKLLCNLGRERDRRARFVCVIAVATPDGEVKTVEGEVRGVIIGQPRGRNGFGYDPVFLPDGYTQTFAELPSEVKNGISHRANALRAALADGLFG